MAPSFEWWAKETHKGTPVVVKMENPNNWSMVELESLSDDDFLSPEIAGNSNSGNTKSKSRRNKNAKQLTWVLLLKAHKAAGCLTSIASALFNLSSAVRRRVAAGKTDSDESESPVVKTRFYTCIKVFLWLSVLLLSFEIVAYYKGWNFGAPDLELEYLYKLTRPSGLKDAFDLIYSNWVMIRADYLAPPLQFLANSCIILFLIQSLDRLVLCLGCFWIRFKKIKPVLKQGLDDLEAGDNGTKGYFPMVLVQIPMCNEKEVYQQSIGAVCNLDWPKSKLLIQFLDDSDDPTTQLLIQDEVHKWQQEVPTFCIGIGSQNENDDEIIDGFIDGCSLLHLACQTADIGMVELLLQHGARINALDTRGQTSLHHNIIRERIVITKLLLRRPRNEVGSAALQP